MTNMIMGTLLAIGYLAAFWIFGAAVPDRFQSKRIPVMCITGFLLYYTLFELVAFPMKYAGLPLSCLTIAWGCVMLTVFLYVIWKKRTVLFDSLKDIPGCRQKNISLFILAVSAIALALLVGFNTNTLSNYDSNNYIGLPVASVYSNTLDRVAPYAGTLLESPEEFYMMNTDTLQSAIVYQVLNIHPLMERKWSFTIAMTILFEMGLYQCAKTFFKKKEYAGTVFVLLADLALLFSYSISGVSHYFAYRTYEGKSIIAYFYMTVIFCFCLSLYRQEKGAWQWLGLFLCSAGGIAFSNSALFIVPCMTGCTLLPYVFCDGIMKKHWGLLRNYVLVLLPSVIWLVVYQMI